MSQGAYVDFAQVERISETVSREYLKIFLCQNKVFRIRLGIGQMQVVEG